MLLLPSSVLILLDVLGDTVTQHHRDRPPMALVCPLRTALGAYASRKVDGALPNCVLAGRQLALHRTTTARGISICDLGSGAWGMAVRLSLFVILSPVNDHARCYLWALGDWGSCTLPLRNSDYRYALARVT